MGEAQRWEAAVRAARSVVDRRTGEARQVGLAGQREEAEVARLSALAEQCERANVLLTGIGEAEQLRVQLTFEGLVTRGLQAIFGTELSFHLRQETRANRTELDFVIRSGYDTPVETPVMDARGGGMAATVGFMLRLVLLLLTPGVRRILFLDETFAHLSREYETRLAEFLREVADQAGVQIVMVTHSDAYSDVADQLHRLELGPDGTTVLAEHRP